MQKLFENQYLSVFNNIETATLEAEWKSASVNMDKKEYRVCSTALYDIARHVKPSHCLLDLKHFYYTINEDEQEKAIHLSDYFFDKCVKKCAIIPSKGTMEALPIENTIGKIAIQSHHSVKAFKDSWTAKAWLNE